MSTETPIPRSLESFDSPPVSAAVPGEESSGDGISVLDILIAIAEQKHIVMFFGILAACMAIGVSLILPKNYTATLTLLPPQQNSSIGAAFSAQIGSMGGLASLAGSSLGIKNPNDMYVAMLKSRTVEDGMVRQFNLMQEYHSHFVSDARKAFENHVTVEGNGKDGLIHISVDDRDPKRAAQLANGYVEQYRHLSEHLAVTEAGQRRLFFEQQLEQAKNNLANAEEAMKVAERKTGLIQLDSQARALIESAASLRAQITAKEVQVESLRTYATDENSQLVQAQQELSSLRAQLAKLGGAGGDAATDLIISKGQVTAAGIEYVRKLRDVKYYEAIFDILARQFEVAKLDEAKQGAVIQVVDAAVPPERRSSPKRAMIVIVSTAVGLLIGVITALITEAKRRARNDANLLRKLSALRNAVRPKWSLSR